MFWWQIATCSLTQELWNSKPSFKNTTATSSTLWSKTAEFARRIGVWECSSELARASGETSSSETSPSSLYLSQAAIGGDQPRGFTYRRSLRGTWLRAFRSEAFTTYCLRMWRCLLKTLLSFRRRTRLSVWFQASVLRMFNTQLASLEMKVGPFTTTDPWTIHMRALSLRSHTTLRASMSSKSLM